MDYYFEKNGTVAGLSVLLSDLSGKGGAGAFFVLAAVGNGFTPDALDPLLQHSRIPVFGGIFPRVIVENGQYERGTVVIPLPGDVNVRIIEDLAGHGPDFDDQLDSLFPALFSGEKDPGGTMFVYLDGFSESAGDLIGSLFNVFGLEINYLGGGTGDLDKPGCATVITPRGLLRDSAVLAYLDIPSGVGVRHGWRTQRGPFKVTQSEKARIITLDWEPAWAVYSGVIRELTGETLNTETLQHLASGHPFGIGKLGAELVVRDPIAGSPDEGIVCVGDVPEGCFVDILSGNTADLVAAAEEAREDAWTGLPSGGGNPVCLIMDCISRFLFLKDEFQQELDALRHPDVRMAGALTVGEIANNGRSFLEFFNKTVVVGLLEER